MKKVAVIMGSDNDLPVVQKAIDTLQEYGVPYEVHVYSAHRTPDRLDQLCPQRQRNGFGAIHWRRLARRRILPNLCGQYYASSYWNPCEIIQPRRH